MPSAAPVARGFEGLTVASFESRMALEIGRLIAHYGGRPLVAPSMKEIPLERNEEAIEFGAGLLAGRFDILLLLTGVGTRTLVDILETRHPRPRILEALVGVKRGCRGPNPPTVRRRPGLRTTLTLCAPQTVIA